MSTNQNSRLLFEKKFQGGRTFRAYDRKNDMNQTCPWVSISQTGFTSRTFAKGMYTHLLFSIEAGSTFKYADVVITNRFNMDSVRQTITFPANDKTGDANGVYYTVGKYSCVQGNMTHNDTGWQTNNWVHVIISAYDFYFGNVYIIFYDSANERERYMTPVVVDFTNVPTITENVVKKYNTTKDNVFDSNWQDDDSARVDVLTGTSISESEFYNDYYTTNRLYTNGKGVAETGDTVAGHPLYVVKYTTFVPNKISELYGTSNTSIGFTATEAYLAKTNNKSSVTTDKLSLTIIENTSLNNTNNSVVTIVGDDNSKITGHSQVFYASLSNANFANKTDKELRDYTQVESNFVLTGVHNDWK